MLLHTTRPQQTALPARTLARPAQRALFAVCNEFGPNPGVLKAATPLPPRGFCPHAAGMAVDLGAGLCCTELGRLRRACLKHFDHVLPPYLTPGWVHAECRPAAPCICPHGLPRLAEGDEGPPVHMLQAALCRAGFATLVCGRFGQDTARALRRFCLSRGIGSPPFAGFRVWQALLGPRES